MIYLLKENSLDLLYYFDLSTETYFDLKSLTIPGEAPLVEDFTSKTILTTHKMRLKLIIRNKFDDSAKLSFSNLLNFFGSRYFVQETRDGFQIDNISLEEIVELIRRSSLQGMNTLHFRNLTEWVVEMNS